MLRPTRLLAPAALLAALVVTSSPAVPAAAAATCTLNQVTHGGAGVFANASPRISSNGRVLAFTSDQDYVGQNADGNHEIYRYDIRQDQLTQITSTVGGSFANIQPHLDGDGNHIAFMSNRNIGGFNPDNNREVYRWTSGPVAPLSPVTQTGASVEIDGLTMDDSGDQIFYTSDQDGNDEIYRWVVGQSSPQQLTTTTQTFNDNPEIDGTGRYLVFRSGADFGGLNPDGHLDVWRRDVVSGATTVLVEGSDTSTSYPTDVSDDGRRVAVVSNLDIDGQNPDRSSELYLHDSAARTTDALTVGPVAAYGVTDARVNAAGTRAIFTSYADLTGANEDNGLEVYLRDFGGPGARTTQVLPENYVYNGDVDIDASGRLVTFVSAANFQGANPDGGAEVFVANCGAPPAPVRCDGQIVTVDRSRAERPTTGNDVIRGVAGVDRVDARGGDDRVCGLAGNDRLRGGRGDDRLIGGRGSDTLDGGRGPDTCVGGPGLDTATACTTRIGFP